MVRVLFYYHFFKFIVHFDKKFEFKIKNLKFMYRNIRSKEETFDFESMAINLQSKFPNFKKDIAWRLTLYLRH